MLNRSQRDIMSTWLKNTQPLVSVCCITYNHVDYISEALDSFLMQETNFPFEILVHDDASTDGTKNIILEYAENYPEIIKAVIQTENQYSKAGLIAHRFLFPKAKGKYIALCEGDDYWTDCTKLQKQVQFLEDHPEYVITYTNSQAFNENGLVNIDFGGAKRDVSADELKKCICLYSLTACFRNVIKEVPLDLMSARLGDQVIWSLLGAHGKGKYLADISPAAYRIHEGGVFSMKSKQQWIEMTLITSNALFAYYKRIGDSDNASYFSERSCQLSVRAIGLKRVIILPIKLLIQKVLKLLKEPINNNLTS
jgi:glycosyltransferase involved in cell wall biosynthesis